MHTTLPETHRQISHCKKTVKGANLLKRVRFTKEQQCSLVWKLKETEQERLLKELANADENGEGTKDTSITLVRKQVENVLRHTETLIYFMFSAAKIAIASAWKSSLLILP